MTALHLDMQSRQRLQQSMVENVDFVASGVMRVPRFIVVTRCRSESPHDAFKVMLIFETDMLVDKPQASRNPVIKMQSGHDRPPCSFAAFGQ
jgi:hypothetical protein